MEKDNWTLMNTKTQIISWIILIFMGLMFFVTIIIPLMNFWSWSIFLRLFFIILSLISIIAFVYMLKKMIKSDNKIKKNVGLILLIIFIIIIGIFSLYFTHPSLFDRCTSLEDGTKVCGDIDDIEILSYMVYTTGETDYSYENLGEGFIHSANATNYYVSVNLKKNTIESVDEKKITFKFLDKNGNFLDSSWMNIYDFIFNKTTNISKNYLLVGISKESMGKNFEKVEKVSFRISDSLESEKNYCRGITESYYHDERFFGTWINESGEINESCTTLFTEYTFYPNGTGMTPFGKIFWETIVYHDYDEVIVLKMESWYFKDTPYNSTFYKVYPSFEFYNNSNTLWMEALSQDLYNRVPEGKISWWCWTEMYYTKQ